MSRQPTEEYQKPSKYLLVSVNEDGEHEIQFVTSDPFKVNDRFSAMRGPCAIYELDEAKP